VARAVRGANQYYNRNGVACRRPHFFDRDRWRGWPRPGAYPQFFRRNRFELPPNIRGALTVAGRARDLRLHGQLIAVSLLALFLRGGVLSLLVNTWDWPGAVAILFAIGATFAITQPGYAFVLSSSCKWRVGSGTRWQAMAIGLVVYAFVLRLVYLGQVELLPEETYYWNYSRHLDTGYLDHPPMVACLIRLGTAAFGTSQFGVRVGAIFCAAATSFFMYRLTRNLFDKSSALVALVLAQVLPFFFMAGMLMTPDTPLTAAWAAELYFLERALVAGRSGAWLGARLIFGHWPRLKVLNWLACSVSAVIHTFGSAIAALATALGAIRSGSDRVGNLFTRYSLERAE
jgi:hypothetical protein